MCSIEGFVTLACVGVFVTSTFFIYHSTNLNPKLPRPQMSDSIFNEEVTTKSFSSRAEYKTYTNINEKKIFSRNKYCLLPPHPPSGWWSLIQDPSELGSQALVPQGTVLEIRCNHSYTLDGCRMVVCIDGHWIPEIGTCLKTCPPLLSQSSLTVTCTYKDKEVENCTNPFDGTYAQFTCGYFYKDIRRNKRKIYCNNGKWSEEMTECVPVCGQGSVNPTLVVNGSPVKKGDFPWQVAIYKNQGEERQLLICGGSLISARVVLTAAHCLTDNEGNKERWYLFTVAVGKYYRDYYDVRDLDKTQFSTIQQIIIHKFYKADHQNYLADIAIMVTDKTFTFSSRVQPVCVDWEEAHKSKILQSSTLMGQVSGWGYTEDGKVSQVLKNLTVPLIDNKDCFTKLPEEFQDYFTHDKICAGYLEQGTSVCQGDSGGGLVLKFGAKYYITGIVSVSPLPDDTGRCNSDQYALYTDVYHYMEQFLLPKVIAFKPKFKDDKSCDSSECTTTISLATEMSIPSLPDVPNGGCTVPDNQYFLNGKWSILNGLYSNESLGQVVFGTILKLECHENYILDGNSSVSCEDGFWNPYIGICLKTCPPIYSTSTINVTCSYDEYKLENCVGATDGTILKYKCGPFYESRTILNFPIFCSDGEWSPTLPECVPICGQAVTTSEKQEYPWHVTLYDARNASFVCSGTLLNEKVVLTAAHCVTNNKGDLLPKAQFSVVAGKSYRKYPRGHSLHHFSAVDEIFVPKQYQGYLKNYFSDIAIVVTKTSFKLSEKVQPVCVDWDKQYQNEVLEPQWNQQNFFISANSAKLLLFSKRYCNADLLEDFDVYMTEDKLCSLGLQNAECGISTGEGLIFQEEERFYIAGVLSVSSGKNPKFACGEYHFFTQIYHYIDNFLLKRIDVN